MQVGMTVRPFRFFVGQPSLALGAKVQPLRTNVKQIYWQLDRHHRAQSGCAGHSGATVVSEEVAHTRQALTGYFPGTGRQST